MFCASPSGLRRWTWDNDTSTAKLGAMGDVAWGKVGAGALHYNADGQQVAMKKNGGGRGGSNIAKIATMLAHVFFFLAGIGVERVKGMIGSIVWWPPHEQSLQAGLKVCLST